MDALHNEDGAVCLFGRLESTHRDLIPLSCSFVDGTTEVNYGRTPQDVTPLRGPQDSDAHPHLPIHEGVKVMTTREPRNGELVGP